jgi:hypothetical protein
MTRDSSQLSVAFLLEMQRKAGNQAVVRLLGKNRSLAAEAHAGGTDTPPGPSATVPDGPVSDERINHALPSEKDHARADASPPHASSANTSLAAGNSPRARVSRLSETMRRLRAWLRSLFAPSRRELPPRPNLRIS